MIVLIFVYYCFNVCFSEWPSGLRRCSKNRKFLGSNPTRLSAGLRDPTSLRGSRWLSGWKCKTQWLTSGEWGYLLSNCLKLAVGQPNNSLKKRQMGEVRNRELQTRCQSGNARLGTLSLNFLIDWVEIFQNVTQNVLSKAT